MLVVTTPAHPAGDVDVTVVTGDQRTVAAFNAFLYDKDNEANYERILLPIYLEVPTPGSNGSIWQTRLWLRNNGANSITLGKLCTSRRAALRALQSALRRRRRAGSPAGPGRLRVGPT